MCLSKLWHIVSCKLSKPGGRWEVVASVMQLCRSPPVGARVWRGDTWLCVGKIHTVCCHPHFSLIYFYHFLLWPSLRCTSRRVPFQGITEKLAFASYLTAYREFLHPHRKQCAFTRKTSISSEYFHIWCPCFADV